MKHQELTEKIIDCAYLSARSTGHLLSKVFIVILQQCPILVQKPESDNEIYPMSTILRDWTNPSARMFTR